MQESKPEEPAKQEEKVDIDLNDPETADAALKIQAGFRGYKTRKEVQEKIKDGKPEETSGDTEAKPEEQKTEEPKSEETKPDDAAGEQKQEEKVDIDLSDPDVQNAATKIQAGFKGYKVRQDMKQQLDSKAGGETEKTEETTTAAPAGDVQQTEQSSTEQAPTEQAPTEQTPTEQAPTEQAPTEQAPTEQAPTEQTPTEQAPTEQAPTEQAPTEQAPTEQAPTEQTPTEQAPTEQAPTEQAPTEQAPTEQAPTEQAPTEQAPTEQAPTEEQKPSGEEIVFDNNDTNTHAATRIQAGYRGHKARKGLKETQSQKEH